MERSQFRPSIIYRYIFKEISTPFLVTLFIFTAILFLIRSLKLVDMVVNKDVSASDILLLFSFIIPRFLEVAIPMSILIGVILAFGRLSGDSELIVLRATGISLRRLTLPVFGFASLAVVFAFLMAFWVRPWAEYRLGMGLFEIAKAQASTGLVPGVFNDVGQLTIYAEDTGQKNGRLENVIISDRRNQLVNRVFIAKHGQIISDEMHRTLVLKLYNGSIQEGTGLNPKITYYENNDINLNQDELMEGEMPGGKKSDEMYLSELYHAMGELGSKPGITEDETHRLNRYQVEFHRRLALSVSCLCVALVAMMLGIQQHRTGESWGLAANILIGIGVIVFYYLLFAIATALGEEGVLAAWILMWLPDVLLAILAIVLFRQMGSERWLAVNEAIGDQFSRFCYKLGIFDREHHGTKPTRGN